MKLLPVLLHDPAFARISGRAKGVLFLFYMLLLDTFDAACLPMCGTVLCSRQFDQRWLTNGLCLLERTQLANVDRCISKDTQAAISRCIVKGSTSACSKICEGVISHCECSHVLFVAISCASYASVYINKKHL